MTYLLHNEPQKETLILFSGIRDKVHSTNVTQAIAVIQFYVLAYVHILRIQAIKSWCVQNHDVSGFLISQIKRSLDRTQDSLTNDDDDDKNFY